MFDLLGFSVSHRHQGDVDRLDDALLLRLLPLPGPGAAEAAAAASPPRGLGHVRAPGSGHVLGRAANIESAGPQRLLDPHVSTRTSARLHHGRVRGLRPNPRRARRDRERSRARRARQRRCLGKQGMLAGLVPGHGVDGSHGRGHRGDVLLLGAPLPAPVLPGSVLAHPILRAHPRNHQRRPPVRFLPVQALAVPGRYLHVHLHGPPARHGGRGPRPGQESAGQVPALAPGQRSTPPKPKHQIIQIIPNPKPPKP